MSEYVVRPDVTCTFSIMQRCDDHFGSGSATSGACHEGARDAHLLTPQRWAFSTGAEQAAYDAGQYTTHRDCGAEFLPTLVPVAVSHSAHHAHEHEHESHYYSCHNHSCIS